MRGTDGSSVVLGFRLDDRPYSPHGLIVADAGTPVGPGRRDLSLEPAQIALGPLGRLEF